MNLTVNNSQPNFNAKLQLRGNISLLDNNGIRTIKKITDKIGSNTDIIDINLPDKFSKNKANTNIAGYVNGVLEQYTVSTEKSNILKSIISGIENIKKLFPQEKNTTENDNLNKILSSIEELKDKKLSRDPEYVSKKLVEAILIRVENDEKLELKLARSVADALSNNYNISYKFALEICDHLTDGHHLPIRVSKSKNF